jgi:glyoxylase-like metal-dependent hydrolase (beta-lactamase superfamily II)
MILRQFLHNEPVAASYLFGCGGKAIGAVVDPVGNIKSYLVAANQTGMRIRYVINTHLHADHVSVGRALAKAAGAEYVLFTGAGRHNKAFSIGDKSEFVRTMTTDIPPAPAEAAKLRAINSGVLAAAE